MKLFGTIWSEFQNDAMNNDERILEWQGPHYKHTQWDTIPRPQFPPDFYWRESAI